MDCGAVGVAMSPRTACSEDSHHALHISPKPALVREAVLVRDQASGVCRVSKLRQTGYDSIGFFLIELKARGRHPCLSGVGACLGWGHKVGRQRSM
jgi:hypothetical protein